MLSFSRSLVDAASRRLTGRSFFSDPGPSIVPQVPLSPLAKLADQLAGLTEDETTALTWDLLGVKPVRSMEEAA